MRHVRNRIASLACACLALFAVATAYGAEPTQDPVEAVWRPQRLMFQYRSEGTTYACGILEYKIKAILSTLGARDEIQIQRVRCQHLAGLAQFEVLMESPVVATAENIRDITNYDSQDVLIARARGMTLPAPEDLERFPAAWEVISFRSAGKLHLGDGDCALMQQLRRQILSKMSVQVIKDIKRVNCSHAGPRLSVLALVATDEKRVVYDAASQRVKLAGEVWND